MLSVTVTINNENASKFTAGNAQLLVQWWPSVTSLSYNFTVLRKEWFCFSYLYRRNTKGITAKLDDDLLKFYCNEDTFLMQVTAIELEGGVVDTIMYDITLCDLSH